MRRVLQVLGLSGALATGLVATNALAADPPRRCGYAEEPKVVEPPVAAAPTVAADANAAPAPASQAQIRRHLDERIFPWRFRREQPKGPHDLLPTRPPRAGCSRSTGSATSVRSGPSMDLRPWFMPAKTGRSRTSTSCRPLSSRRPILATRRPGSPLRRLSSPGTGATVAFPNLYVDIKGIPWLDGGTAWAGTRYYKRESIYISDFFYWNPSGVGGGHRGHQSRQATCGSATPLSRSTVSRAGRRSCRRKTTSAFETICSFEGSSPTEVASSRSALQYIADFSDDKDANGNPSPTGDGASRCGTSRRCSAATTSWSSSTAEVGAPASERWPAFITPTSRSART